MVNDKFSHRKWDRIGRENHQTAWKNYTEKMHKHVNDIVTDWSYNCMLSLDFTLFGVSPI